MNIDWKDIFNTSHSRYHLQSAIDATVKSGYKYFWWNGWIYDAQGNQLCLEEDLTSGKILKPLAEGVQKKDLSKGGINVTFCSWNRMTPFFSQAANGRKVVGVKANNEGFEIITE